MSERDYLIAKAQATLGQKLRDPEWVAGYGTTAGGAGLALHSLATVKNRDLERMLDGATRGANFADSKMQRVVGAKPRQVGRLSVVHTDNKAQRAARKVARGVGWVGGTIGSAPTRYKVGLGVSTSGALATALANRRLARDNKEK